MCWEERFRGLASRQEGLIGRINLDAIGCTNDEWWRARRSGRWDILSSHVVRVRGSAPTDAQRALAAVLDASPGAVLHGPSTLAWFGLRGYDLATIHVVRPRDMSGQAVELAELHELRKLRAVDVAVVRGVPTETALRAIWTEAARYSSPGRLDLGFRKIGRLLDDAHVKGLVTWGALADAVEDLHQRGRAGTRLMRALANDRPPGSSPTETRLEDRFEEVLEATGARPFRRQVVVGGCEEIGRVDFRDDDLPLVVEVNSLAFHSTPSDQAADEIRHLRLNEAGLMVGVVWEDDLWSRTGSVIRLVREARGRAAAGTRNVLHSPGCPWPCFHTSHDMLPRGRGRFSA